MPYVNDEQFIQCVFAIFNKVKNQIHNCLHPLNVSHYMGGVLVNLPKALTTVALTFFPPEFHYSIYVFNTIIYVQLQCNAPLYKLLFYAIMIKIQKHTQLQ